MLFGMYPASMAGLSQAQNTYAAHEIARDRLQYWKNQGYAWVAGSHSSNDLTGSVAVTSTANRSLFGKITASGSPSTTTFTWIMTHSPAVPGGVEEVYAVVSWTQVGGGSGEVLSGGMNSGGIGQSALHYVRMSTWVNQ